MKLISKVVCLIAVISLTVGVIWPNSSAAVQAPTMTFLEQISAGMSAPGDVAMDRDGNIYVADARRGILRYNRFGSPLPAIQAPVTGAGLAVSPAGDRIYASANDQVLVFAPDGTPLNPLGQGVGEFGFAADIDLDANGNVYVVDSRVHTVNRYSADGTPATTYAGSKSFSVADDGIDSIAAMAIDRNTGLLYIADRQGTNGAELRSYSIIDGSVQVEVVISSGLGATVGGVGGLMVDQQSRLYVLDAVSYQVLVVSAALDSYVVMSVAGMPAHVVDNPKGAYLDVASNRVFMVAGSRVNSFGVDTFTLPSNAIPPVPQPITPVAGSEVEQLQPTLAFAEVIDADADPVSYQIELSCGGDVSSFSGIAASPFQVGSNLVENGACDWKVRADDGKDLSGWSVSAAFVVNATPEAPSAPVLADPVNGSQLQAGAAFSWLASVDPDPNGLVGASYTIEVAADSTFTPVLAVAQSTTLTQALDQLTGVDVLVGGQTYSWRVSCEDSSGMVSGYSEVRSFNYQKLGLVISANMPGAKVYLGGNNQHAGQFAGVTPLLLDGMEPGSYSVVVKYPGMQTETRIIQVGNQEQTVNFTLQPALLATGYAQLQKLDLGQTPMVAPLAPFPVDFDNDGQLDLLVGDAAGAVYLLAGQQDASGVISFATPQAMALTVLPKAVPFVVDWNNDFKKDLLVGQEDGTVMSFLNSGTDVAPQFGQGGLLAIQGQPLTVAGAAAPVVVDLDGDQDKDLVVGDGNGGLTWFENLGSDAAPQLAPGLLLGAFGAAVTPLYTDLDADGSDDLVVATAGKIVPVTLIDGVVQYGQSMVVYGDAKIAKTVKKYQKVIDRLVASMQRTPAGKGQAKLQKVIDRYQAKIDRLQGKLQDAKFALIDFDSTGAADILFALGDKVEIAASENSIIADTFKGAANDKIDQFAELLAASQPGALQGVGAIRGFVDAGDFIGAAGAVSDLLATVTAAEAVVAGQELENILSIAAQ